MSHTSNVLKLRENHVAADACQSCLRRSGCPVYEMGGGALLAERNPVQHLTTRQGQSIFEAGDRFDGIYLVRSGFFKSSFVDSDGEMQVTGFHFPGELFGVDGIENGAYSQRVEALDTGSLCRIPFSLFTGSAPLAGASAGQGEAARQRMMLSLVRIMSKVIARDRSMIFALGKMGARRRFATFLLDISERMENSGYNSRELRLCMSRIDIANYLGLAVETISRLFTLFQNTGLLRVNRRQLTLLDKPALQALVEGGEEGAHLLDQAG